MNWVVLKRTMSRKMDGIKMSENRGIKQLLACHPQNYIFEINPVIINVLLGMSGIKPVTRYKSVEHQQPFFQNAYQICLVAESVIGLTGAFILPLYFRLLVLLYTLTRSRLSVSILGSSGPFGSYQTVKLWLDEISKNDDNTQTSW